LKLYTKGLNVIICDSKRTFGDFSSKINAHGLDLTSFESWGTETANYANFVHFSSVFKHFASETYKTQSWDIFSILMHIWVFLNVLVVQMRQKWWVFTHSSIDDDESQETHDESFGQFENSSQNIEDDPYDSDIEVEMPREALEILGKMLGLDYNKTHVEDIGYLDTRNDEVNNISSQSTPQVLPSFEANTPPVTYPEEVEETIGTPIEVEPLDQTQLEEIGLNTCNHNLSFSSKEVPSFDEPEPQPNPLPNLPSLDESLGMEKGPDPPIKPYSPGSFTLKIVDPKPCREEADIGTNHDLTYLHNPFMSDHKKHYGFKPCLLGQDGFPTRSLSKLIENDPFLGENFNSPIDQSELGKVMMKGAHPFEHIIHSPLSPHVACFHPKGVYRYFHLHLIFSVGKTSTISVK
jgi:hypothetical protein